MLLMEEEFWKNKKKLKKVLAIDFETRIMRLRLWDRSFKRLKKIS